MSLRLEARRENGVALRVHLACRQNFRSNPEPLLIHVPESLTVARRRGQQSLIKQFKDAVTPTMKRLPGCHSSHPYLLNLLATSPFGCPSLYEKCVLLKNSM